ncbi:unnamed protein product [Dibothriocephalus latus]|uniref:Major facilitator superfamily (MFS) profile domain-containing protein n=1 Tax=Dibothriocephalus latus TaxID=60516 RepID=A0A3P7LFI6_DIBLA|nr:unnamed protein product [Dibothriocephalus latus]
MQSVSMPIGGLLAPKIGFRAVTIMGMILSSGGILLSRLTVDHGLGPFIVTYCIMFGLGIGLPYSVLMSVASSWFPEHRATIVGIITAGFGCGALLFTPIQTKIINPQGLTNLTDPSIKAKVPNAFLILGGIMLGLQIIGFIICREKKVVEVAETIGSENDAKLEQDDEYSNAYMKPICWNNSSQYALCPSPQKTSSKKLYTEGSFTDYRLLFVVVDLLLQRYTHNAAILDIQGTFEIHISVYGGESGLDDHYLSIIATLSSAFNALGRVLWGIIVDHFSYKCPYGILTFLWAVFFATFPAIGSSSALRYIYPIWVFTLFFLLAGHFVISPGAAGRIFGPKNMATLYGLIFFATVSNT